MTVTATLPAVERTGLVRRHPILTFAVGAILPTWATQLLFLIMGWEFFPAMLLEIGFLLGSAVLVTAHTQGRTGIHRLFAGAVRWRMGAARFAVVLLALPALTVGIAAVSGSLRAPDGGVGKEALTYLFLTLIFGAVLGNVWEETAWAGFAQRRLMDRHGPLVGSLLTAIPFALIHLPLAFADHGLHGTSGRDVAITWTVLILTAPFFRYLLGTVLIDTGGSVLAVAILHASFNASGQLTAVHGWWPGYAALLALVALTAAHRHRKSAPRRHARAAAG
jgi:membrane protease YdiL (CAAX protease family)